MEHHLCLESHVPSCLTKQRAATETPPCPSVLPLPSSVPTQQQDRDCIRDRAGSRHQQTKHMLGVAHFQGRHSGHLFVLFCFGQQNPRAGHGSSSTLCPAAAAVRATREQVPHLVAGPGRVRAGDNRAGGRPVGHTVLPAGAAG